MLPCPIENFVRIAIPLHHPEDTYTFMFTPEYPGEMVIEVVSSWRIQVAIAHKDEDIKKVHNVKPREYNKEHNTPVPRPFSLLVPDDTPPHSTKHATEFNGAGNNSMIRLDKSANTMTINKGMSNKRPREIDPDDDSPTEPESEDIPNDKDKENTFYLSTKRVYGELTKKCAPKYEKPNVTFASGRK